MNPKFKLLILSNNLLTDDYYKLSSQYLNTYLQTDLYLPNCNNKPFIFSCFALSVDGKLCYPDSLSGYSIAANNYQATTEERYADYWNLLLGRSISDAVIIGRNSLINENFKYQALVNHNELASLRKTLGKSDNLLHIVITRNINNIDFEQELICQNNNIPVIIYTKIKPSKDYQNFIIRELNEIDLNHKKQIIYHNDFLNFKNFIDKLFSLKIKTILNESPFLHHSLQQQHLLHEAWLNTSGIYIGGTCISLGQSEKSFTSSDHPHYDILSLHHIATNFLYTRYSINYSK